MKKWIGVVLAFSLLFILTGCGEKKETKKLNLEQITSNINQLTYQNEQKEETKLFLNNKNVEATVLKNKYGFDTIDMEEFIVSMPSMLDHSSMYIIASPKQGKEANVKEQIKQFFSKYYAQWSAGNYAPKEVSLIENRLETSHNGYLIYIVSNDNETVLNEIKNTK